MVTDDPYGIAGAVRPWDSLDAQRPAERIHTCDSPDRIKRCLDCQRETCSGTCTGTAKGVRGRAVQVDVDAIRRLNATGHTMGETARILGCSRTTVSYWIKKMDLPQVRDTWSMRGRLGRE